MQESLRRSLAILFNLYGNVRGIDGDLPSYRTHAAEALRIAERLGDEGSRQVFAVRLARVVVGPQRAPRPRPLPHAFRYTINSLIPR